MATGPYLQNESPRLLPDGLSPGSAGLLEKSHPVLAAPSVRLRALAPTDRKRLVEVLARHPCACATLDEPHSLDSARAARWIDSRIAEEKLGYALHWAICPLSDDGLIGYVGLHDIDLDRSHAELCFWLEPVPGSGTLLLEATQSTLAFAFENLHLESMRAVSLPGKADTAELLHGLGMRCLQPASASNAAWTRFNDVHIWTLTRSRWEHGLLKSISH